MSQAPRRLRLDPLPPNENRRLAPPPSPGSGEEPAPSMSIILDIADGPAGGMKGRVVLSPGQRTRMDALADAEHLDALESSDAVTDIASFQDIELPPPARSPTGQISLGGGAEDFESYRKAKKFYYCLPKLKRYSLPILGCLLVVAMLATAIGLTVNSVDDVDDAPVSPLGQSGGDGTDKKVNSAPAPVPPGSYSEWAQKMSQQLAEHGDVGAVSAWEEEERLNAKEGTQEWQEQHGKELVEGEEANFGIQPPTPEHPKWFGVMHEKYQTFLANQEDQSSNGAHHPTHFCPSQGMKLCAYPDICPDGRGKAPFQGGFPGIHQANELKRYQWVPVHMKDGSVQKVQAGEIPQAYGGDEDANGMGRCWSRDEWIGVGHLTQPANTEWAAKFDPEQHHMWILCCPADR